MHNSMITELLETIKVKDQIILLLLRELNKYCPLDVPQEDPIISLEYQKLTIDDSPIFEQLEKLDYKQLIVDYQNVNNKPLKPVKRRTGGTPIPKELCCPRCDAPSDYLYANNGDSGQFQCKICSYLFSKQNKYNKQVLLKCPHCLHQLVLHRKRKKYDVFRCVYNDCSLYRKKLAAMTAKQRKVHQKNPSQFKLRFFYRSFRVDLVPLAKKQPNAPVVDLSKIYSSPETLGLIMTYYVNYELSARKTASIMKDVHNLDISYQTILNYANAMEPILKYFVETFPYELSDKICGDETYIRVKGKWFYLTFFFDAEKKIILAHPISANRDTELAIHAINDVLTKMQEIPEDLIFVVDGNPIYPLAQHFFAEHGINFAIKQVIGVSNKDEVSAEYRPLKQVIERLNRTFKSGYRDTFGFGSHKGANSFTTLFVAFFNFLRPHASLEQRVPVVIPELVELPNMPARWLHLIQMAQKSVLDYQNALT